MDFDTTNSTNQNTYQTNSTQSHQTPPRICPRCHNVCNDRFCLFCGFDLAISQQAQYQQHYGQGNYPYQNYYNPNPMYYQPQFQAVGKPNKKVVWPFIMGGVFLVVVIITVAIILINSLFHKNGGLFNEEFPGALNQYESDNILPNGVSKQELKQLKEGMSYAHVSSIIGGDGVLTEQGTTPLDETYYTYQWAGETNPYATVYITFINDKLSGIVNNGV